MIFLGRANAEYSCEWSGMDWMGRSNGDSMGRMVRRKYREKQLQPRATWGTKQHLISQKLPLLPLCFVFWFVCFETGFHQAAQAALKLAFTSFFPVNANITGYTNLTLHSGTKSFNFFSGMQKKQNIQRLLDRNKQDILKLFHDREKIRSIGVSLQREHAKNFYNECWKYMVKSMI